MLSPAKVKILLAVALATAVFFRFFMLGGTPPGLYDDEAISGVEAQRALETGDFSVYYQITPQIDLGPTLRGTFGTEGLYINLVAVSIKILGNEPVAIRAVSALAGVLTVLGLFLLARVIFDKSTIDPNVPALVAAYLLAIVFWHVNFSRIGFHAILMPLASVFSFYFLFRGFSESGRKPHFMLAGAFLGLGFHTYISFRIVPIVALLVIILKLIEKRPKRFAAEVGLFVVSAIVVSLPMLVYFIGHSDDFLYRARGLSLFGEPDWPAKLLGNFMKALGEFNVAGDAYMRHNIPGAQQLPWTMGAFFLVGVTTAVARIISFAAKKGKPVPTIEAFLLVWLITGIVPAAMAISPHPHALRSIGAVLPAVMLTAQGMTLVYFMICGRVTSDAVKKGLAAIAVAFLVVTGALEYKRYFHDWARSPELGYRYFDQQTHDIGRFINSQPIGVKKFVVVNYRPETVQFLTESFTESGRQRKNIVYLFPEQKINIEFASARPYVVIPLYDDPKLYRALSENVPGRFVREEYFDYIISE